MISSVSGISELSGIWWKIRKPGRRGKFQSFGRFWEGGEEKKTEISVSKSPPKGSGILTDF